MFDDGEQKRDVRLRIFRFRIGGPEMLREQNRREPREDCPDAGPRKDLQPQSVKERPAV